MADTTEPVQLGDFERKLGEALRRAGEGERIVVHALAMDLARALRAEAELLKPSPKRIPRVVDDESIARSGRGILFDDQLAAVQAALTLLSESDAPMMNHHVAGATNRLRDAVRRHQRVSRADEQLRSLLGFAKDQDIELTETQRDGIYQALLDEAL